MLRIMMTKRPDLTRGIGVVLSLHKMGELNPILSDTSILPNPSLS